MMLIGQDRLNKLLENISVDIMPRSLILSGPKGCGKHLFCSLLQEKLNIPVSDITDKLDFEFIIELYTRTTPNIYIIDSTNIMQKEQNRVLKFLEEPLKNSFIIILCESLNQLLDTVINRCEIIRFQPYTVEQLRQFDPNIDETILHICNTPGDIISYKNISLEPYLTLAHKMIEKMRIAAISNAISISDKIAFKDESDKLDLNLFKKVLLNTASAALVNQEINNSFFDAIRNYLTESSQPRVNQKYLFDNLITTLWLISHGH